MSIPRVKWIALIVSEKRLTNPNTNKRVLTIAPCHFFINTFLSQDLLLHVFKFWMLVYQIGVFLQEFFYLFVWFYVPTPNKGYMALKQ
jgi:hypothetical protein